MGIALKTGDFFLTDGVPPQMTVLPISNTNTKLFINFKLAFHQGNILTGHVAPPDLVHPAPIITQSVFARPTRVFVNGKPIATSADISSCNPKLILKPITPTSLIPPFVFVGPPIP